jgi:phage protein D
MTTYKKNYIGKGTQVKGMEIVKVTLPIAELLKYKHEFEGEEYVTFEVAKMQNPDKFGREYTVYCTTKEETEEKQPAPKSRKRKTEAATA